jgi:hypothetical protein
MMFAEREKRINSRQLDINRLELMIAELEDMRSRHLSTRFRVRCNDAIRELVEAQRRLQVLVENDTK